MAVFVFDNRGGSGCDDDRRQLRSVLLERGECGLSDAVLVVGTAAADDPPQWLAELAPRRIVLVGPDRHEDDSGRRFPQQGQSGWGDYRWWSQQVLSTLLRLRNELGEIDCIEFPATGALAFAALQERLLCGVLADSKIALRLSGSSSMQAARSGTPMSVAALYLADLERKCAADCDWLVASSDTVAESFRENWGFKPAQWRHRCVFRPSVPKYSSTAVAAAAQLERLRAVVASEHAARLFVRGCVGLMRTLPDWKGSAEIGPAAIAAPALAVAPEGLRARFALTDNDAAPTTAGAGVWIGADDWSADALAAIEAADEGAICVLNARNPAYRDVPEQARRIAKFDGTLQGLVNALRVVVADAPPAVVELVARERGAAATPPRVSVIVPHFNLGTYLPQTLASILASTYSDLEVLLVDDASTDPASLQAVRRAGATDARIRVVELEYNRGLAGARNVGVDLATGEYVLTMDADDLIHPDFVHQAVQALDRHRDFDFVVPQAAYFSGEEDRGFADIRTDGCLPFSGEARQAGVFANLFSTATCLARRTVLAGLRYREELRAYEDWDLYRRAVASGSRFIVGNEIMLLYRYRADSMIHSADMRGRQAKLMNELMRASHLSIDGVPLPTQTLQVVTAAVSADAYGALLSDYPNALAELQAYRDSPAVKLALSLSRAVSKYLPGAKRWLRRGRKGG